MLWLIAVADPIDLSAEASREVARQECRLREEAAEVTVCGRRDQQKRYQVTDPNAPFDPKGSTPSVASERMRWAEGGETGPGSCSGIGPGGWTGCMQKEWRRRLQQKGWLIR